MCSAHGLLSVERLARERHPGQTSTGLIFSTNGHAEQSRLERLEQGYLYPLGEHRDMISQSGHEPPPPAPQARTLPKELSTQLFRWLFGTSTKQYL
jgi:hypothetical protein